MNDRSRIATLYQTVWSNRRMHAEHWPVPPPRDSVIFAISELGEVADAIMRLKSGYVRNHERNVDLGKELAQVVEMAMLCIEPDFDLSLFYEPHIYTGGQNPLVVVTLTLGRLAELLFDSQSHRDTALFYAVSCVIHVYYYADRLAREHEIDDLETKIVEVSLLCPVCAKWEAYHD